MLLVSMLAKGYVSYALPSDRPTFLAACANPVISVSLSKSLVKPDSYVDKVQLVKSL
jgi:hypothetical protein